MFYTQFGLFLVQAGFHKSFIISQQRSSPDVKAEMFELLYQILHQNWRYFFKNSVLITVQRGASEDTMENEAQFTAAMQVSGQNFSAKVVTTNLFCLLSFSSNVFLFYRPLDSLSYSLTSTFLSRTFPI